MNGSRPRANLAAPFLSRAESWPTRDDDHASGCHHARAFTWPLRCLSQCGSDPDVNFAIGAAFRHRRDRSESDDSFSVGGSPAKADQLSTIIRRWEEILDRTK